MNTKKIYLDYQATTPVSEKVLKKMMPYFTEKFGNPHSNNHSFGRETAEAIEDAREKIAKLINAEPSEIIFTSGATESNNIAIKSIAKSYFDKDFHVITVKTEHKCVLESCYALEQDNIKVHYLDVNDKGFIDLNTLENLLKAKPSFVSIMLANNEIGIIQPLKEVGDLCKKYKAILHSDVAQGLEGSSVDVKYYNLHAASISAHKIYGPKGIGALYLSNEIKNTIKPLMSGGGQEMGLRSGTLSPALCVGFGEACSQINKYHNQYMDHYYMLKSTLVSELEKANINFAINGDTSKRLPNNLNIRIKNKEALALFNQMPHIALSTGSACTSGAITRSHVLTALKLSDEQIDESFRISLGRSTTTEDINEFVLQIKKS
jgi:cysteine desulfurase